MRVRRQVVVTALFRNVFQRAKIMICGCIIAWNGQFSSPLTHLHSQVESVDIKVEALIQTALQTNEEEKSRTRSKVFMNMNMQSRNANNHQKRQIGTKRFPILNSTV